MANPTPTLNQVLQGLNPDHPLTVGGIRWRAEALLQYLIQRGDARLTENCVVGTNGAITLYASGMGAVDSTTPAIVDIKKNH